VVEVATEDDVSETVRFTYTHNIPFLAQSGAHGGTAALGALKTGIQIHMRGLNSLTVASDGTYATIGGGIKVIEVRDKLWAENKWTVHGCCECPGLMAVALGGGHGLLQGRYALLSDQILALNVVLANGTAVKVSDSSHPDLFWAMQGAGHNFGIVTSLDYKIYDIPSTEVGGKIWSHEILTYDATPENVKSVYGLSNKMLEDGSQPDGLSIYGVIAIDPRLSPKPVIMQHIIHNAPLTHLTPFTAPYHAFNPLTITSREGTYLDVPRWINVHEDSIPCNPSQVIQDPGVLRFPVDVKTYNLDVLAAMVTEFSKFVTKNAEFVGSFVMIEQWPTQAVRAKERGRSLVPWRDNGLLIAPALLYPIDNTSTTRDDLAWQTGSKLRQILIDGAKETGGHYSYVNYAYGGESAEEWYGKENLGRLRALKRVYDPKNRFRYYAPI
ncbi:FAD-binding domain-containing protein, partial [Setomelanomma holmii]